MTNVLKELKGMKAIIEGYFKIENINNELAIVEVEEKAPTYEGNYAMGYWLASGEVKRYARANNIKVVTIW